MNTNMHRTALAAVCALFLMLGAGCAAKGRSDDAGQRQDDPAITAKVRTALADIPSLRPDRITVETSNGVVALSGVAGSREAVSRATDIAASVPGVVSVKNDLIVR